VQRALLVGVVDHQHGAPALPEVQQEGLLPVAAHGIAVERSERAARVEHHQRRIVPRRHQAHDAVVAAKIERHAVGAIVGEDFQALRQGAEQGHAVAQLGGAHLAVDIEHAVRPRALPAEEAAAAGDRPGDTEGKEALADAGRPIDQGH
jgi:hypothetical protein